MVHAAEVLERLVRDVKIVIKNGFYCFDQVLDLRAERLRHRP